MPERSWRVMPAEKKGKWSIGLVILMPILFFIGTSFAGSLYESVPAGADLVADISVRPALALSMLAGAAAGTAGFIIGLLAIIRHKERAILVFFSTVIGSFPFLYIIGETLFPTK